LATKVYLIEPDVEINDATILNRPEA